MNEAFSKAMQIDASPESVFSYFVEPEKLVRWMGDFARLKAVADGEFTVDINGVLIRGHYMRLTPFSRIEIAWGELGNAIMPPASTQVVIELQPRAAGTFLTLSHHGLVAEEAEKHAMGWPHFLARLGEAAAGRETGRDPFAG